MGIAVFALSIIMAMTWYVTDRGQNKLEEEIGVRKVTERMLASELGSAQARSAEDALKYTDLEEHLGDEQQKFQKEIEVKQTEKEVALSAHKEMENKLIGAEARLRADEPVFENDNVVRKIKMARTALAKARRAPSAGEGATKRLDSRIRNVERTLREAERVLEEAKESRLATELLISQESIMTLASLTGDTNWAQQVLEKERKSSKVSMENFQDQLRSKNQRELKRQVVNLEERFISFKQSKSIMEGHWSDAMAALVKMDDTARSIEAGLMASLERSAEYESAGGPPIEGLAMLRAEMETLKLARTDVHKVMDDMKTAIARSVESETEMILAETAQVSETLNRMVLEARFRGMSETPEEYVELIRALNIEESIQDPALLDKKLEDLNILTNYLLEASGRRRAAGSGFGAPDSDFDEYMASKLDFDIYVVEEGDTLWAIASKERIYGDPYMWPLLYKYNAARVDDPDVIEPQLKLVVRKQLVGGEIEETLQKARTTSGLKEYRLYNRRWLEELCRP